MTDAPLSVATASVSTTDDDDLDTLVAKASRPNLASLFKAGKEKGLIKPTQEYGHTT